MTSHDAVLAVRARLSTRRVGHTGTLDPFATGLLLLLAGRFTRAMEYFHALAKRYSAVMRLGVETDTEDPTGTPSAESDAWRRLTEDDVRAALAGRVGAGEQRPPSYSAKKVEGRRAYAEARRGARLELAAVPIAVHGLELERFEPPFVAFSATVSTGTYVRSLARDMGRDLECGAHLVELRRTRIGPFRVEDAMAPGDAGRSVAGGDPALVRPAAALAWMPRRRLDGAEIAEIGHGRPIPVGELEPPGPGGGPIGETVRGAVALVAEGELIAVAERRGDELHPRKVFAT